MSTTSTMGPIDADQLSRIWPLADSPNAGEAAAARVLVAKYGKTFADMRVVSKRKAAKAGEHAFLLSCRRQLTTQSYGSSVSVIARSASSSPRGLRVFFYLLPIRPGWRQRMVPEPPPRSQRPG
jgi:hypothetical protein